MADAAVNQEVEIATREASKVAAVIETVKIRKDADLTDATKQVSEVKRLIKNIDGQRKAITGPMRQAIKETDDLFREPLDRLKAAEAMIKAEMIRYTDMVERRAEKRADKIESQVDSGELNVVDAMDKLGRINQAQSSVSTEAGSSHIKTVTRIRILNPADLPAKYFLRPRVMEALRLEVEEDVRKKAEPVPAGAESYQDRQVAVRAA